MKLVMGQTRHIPDAVSSYSARGPCTDARARPERESVQRPGRGNKSFRDVADPETGACDLSVVFVG